jgi:hypothetical protein
MSQLDERQKILNVEEAPWRLLRQLWQHRSPVEWKRLGLRIGEF